MDKLYVLVKEHFPQFVQADYPVFVRFVQEYYKWVEQQQSVGKIEDVVDVDNTPEQFVQYFRNQLDVYGIYSNVDPFDSKYLKTIREIYTAKGSEQALVHLLKVVYNTDAVVTYPSKNILRASDGRWEQESFITINIVFGQLPQTINEIYAVFGLNKEFIPITRYDVIEVDRIRFYYQATRNLALQIDQEIQIIQNGVVVCVGKIVSSPNRLEIQNGGADWQLGQVVVFPGSVKNTIARVTSVSNTGAITGIEILEYGFVHSENDSIVVSSYPAKPVGATYDLDVQIASEDPLAYNYTLTIFDYIDGATDKAQGIKSGILSSSYFLENYVEASYFGSVAFEIGTSLAPALPDFYSPITVERWLASRATLTYKFAPITTMKGRWTDDSGQISNESIRLQDNYYYQQYSYVIESDVSQSEYNVLNQTLHPAGMKAFATYSLFEEIEFDINIETTFPFITIDVLDVVETDDSAAKLIIKPREDDSNFATDSIVNKTLIKERDEEVEFTDIVAKEVTAVLQDQAEFTDLTSLGFVKQIVDTVEAVQLETSTDYNDEFLGDGYFSEDYVEPGQPASLTVEIT